MEHAMSTPLSQAEMTALRQLYLAQARLKSVDQELDFLDVEKCEVNRKIARAMQDRVAMLEDLERATEALRSSIRVEK
jgi:hypothetical protein